MTTAALDAMVQAVTVECSNEEEQLTGLFSMIESHLAMPFDTTVLGVLVTVEAVDLADSGEIVAVCTRDQVQQAIPILKLPLPAPPPQGAEWIDAYRHWLHTTEAQDE